MELLGKTVTDEHPIAWSWRRTVTDRPGVTT